MKKDRDTRELLAMIRTGMRLKTKPPKRETPKSVYNRREKHRRRWNDTSSFFRYSLTGRTWIALMMSCTVSPCFKSSC